jgi:Sigma-70 region 2
MALNPHDVSPKVHPQGHHRCAVQEGRYGWQRSNLASGCGGYDPRPPSHARRPPRPRASRRRPGGNRSPDRALACVLVHDPFEAEDITQEAFLRAWRNLDLLSDPAKFGAWLRRIVFGVSIDWLRVFRPDLYRSTGVDTEVESIAASTPVESAPDQSPASAKDPPDPHAPGPPVPARRTTSPRTAILPCMGQ